MDFILNLLHQGTAFIVPLIVLLGVLIFVHELGHFSVAKFFGVRVEVFSLGFGRKIFKRKMGDTTYCISAIPFGGYVKMFGDDPSAQVAPDEQKYSFTHQRVLPRIAIVLAGPLMNAFFAFLLFTVIAGLGEEVLAPQLGDVFPGTAAYDAGFRTGDVVRKIDGMETDRWDSVKKIVEEHSNHRLTFEVERGGKSLSLSATPVSTANKNVLSSKDVVGEIDGLTYFHRASAIGLNNPLSAAWRAGLRTGDIIHKVNGQEITQWTELEQKLKGASGRVALEVERSGMAKNLSLELPVDPQNPLDGLEPSDLYLSSVVAKSGAEIAGIQAGDKLTRINGKELEHWDDVIKTVHAYKEGQPPLKVDVIRSGKVISLSVSPKLISQTDSSGIEEKNFALGVVTGLVYAPPETFVAKEHNPVKMIFRGADDTWKWTKLTVLSFVKLAQRKVSAKSIGGPLMIGKLASETWRIGISPFLKIMSIISINLFVINLLPIPVLDGGHLLFFSIEFVKGSPLSFRKLEVMQQVGMVLLLALMAFSMFNDIIRLFAT